MSATLAHSTPSPVLDGAVCAACNAPLGSATRYCLSCGARQAGARTELLDLVPVASAPAAVAAVSATPVVAPTAVFPAVAPAPASSVAPPSASAGAAPPVPPASVASLAAAGPRTWPFAVTAAVLVALVVGLGAGRLLADGRGGSGDPQVIRIEGAGGAAVVPSTETPAASDAPVASDASATSDAPAAEADPAADAAAAPTPVPTTSGGAE